MLKKKKLVILAAGGTGGHMFPAQAVAEYLLKNDFDVKIITDLRGYKFLKSFCDDLKDNQKYSFSIIETIGLHKKFTDKIRFLIKMIFALIKNYMIFIKKRKKILCVIGFGGYGSCPSILIAKLFGIYTMVHQSDIVVGRANKFLFNFANKILLGINKIDLNNKKFQSKSLYVGIPVREIFEIDQLNLSDKELSVNKVDKNISLNDNHLRILVIGGSQSASIWSKILPDCFKLLNFNHNIIITQQCGSTDIILLEEKYDNLGIKSYLHEFIFDISHEMIKSDIVFARSGASSIAEIAHLSKPIFMIPYPFASQNHQVINAKYISDNNCGWFFEEKDITAEKLADFIKNIFENKQKLQEVGLNLHNLIDKNSKSIILNIIKNLQIKLN